MGFGIDYAWQKPTVNALREKSVEFVCRYLSHDQSGKNLTRSEAEFLSSHGFNIVVVWESTANRALDGYNAGAQDATNALAQAHDCGMPEDRPIYFAVDFDTQSSDLAHIMPYFAGAASVLGKDRVGVYGGLSVVQTLLDQGYIWAWQTYAWSHGRWDHRAQLRQYLNDQLIGHVNVDFNMSIADDYGQWKVGESPMALSDADKAWITDTIEKTVWKKDNCPVPPEYPQDPKNPTWSYENVLRTVADTGLTANQKLDKILDHLNNLQ